MITYEQALKIAKKNKPSIDHAMEYNNCFVFSSKLDAFSFGATPVVIIKETGEAVNYLVFVDELSQNAGDEPIKEFDL